MATSARPIVTAEPAQSEPAQSAPIQDVANEAHALTVAEPAIAEVHAASPLILSPAQIEIIKTIYMVGATDDELAVFVMVCQQRQLNPFVKQIYAIKRKQKREGKYVDVWTFQTSIDGFRLVAKRTGKYRGQTVPLFCGADSVWTDAWLHDEPPKAAKIGVLHADFDQPIYSVALWREYAQTFDDGNLMGMWAKMPSVMLAKVSEALALRKAFPEELSGLYTDDEMAQANNVDRAEARRAAQTQSGDRATGSAKPASPADPFTEIKIEELTVLVAETLPLLGKPDKWGNNGGKPLRDVPEKWLRRVREWLDEKLEIDETLAIDADGKLSEAQLHKFKVTRAAVALVLARIDANQVTLPLDGPAAATPTEAASIAAPSTESVAAGVLTLSKRLGELLEHPQLSADEKESVRHRLEIGAFKNADEFKREIDRLEKALDLGF